MPKETEAAVATQPARPAAGASGTPARDQARSDAARAASQSGPERSAAATARPTPAGAASLTICTQNLWNYGAPESVHALRRRNVSLGKVEADLARQEPALVARMSRCDVVAVQELVGDTTEDAARALTRLAERLSAAEGHSYEARAADTHDVIRNGFLVRKDGPFRVAEFNGHHTADRWPPVPAFPPGRWDRGPAELLLEMERSEGSVPARVRILNAHLKSKIETDRLTDPDGERWERLRVLQARALHDLARLRLAQNPGEVDLVVGDLNARPGAAARAVLGGALDPVALVDPGDCIGPRGELTCDLPSRAALLLDLAALDPDLRGRGSYRFEGREELIDAIFASPDGARLALEPGGDRSGDYDVRLEGRFGDGSDHRMLRVTLHF